MARFRFAIGIALVAMNAPALAQQGPDQAQARQIFEKVIAFRTSQGQGQVPPMVSYIEGVLHEGGVPVENIAKLPKGETVGMLVRIPGTDRRVRHTAITTDSPSQISSYQTPIRLTPES